MDSFPIAALPTTRAAIFVCSTTGQGEVPENMRAFWRFLRRSDLAATSLAGLSFSTFGLGDSSYPLYNAVARRLHQRLLALGARALCPQGLGDDQHAIGYDGALIPWTVDLLAGLRSVLAASPVTAADAAAAGAASGDSWLSCPQVSVRVVPLAAARATRAAVAAEVAALTAVLDAALMQCSASSAEAPTTTTATAPAATATAAGGYFCPSAALLQRAAAGARLFPHCNANSAMTDADSCETDAEAASADASVPALLVHLEPASGDLAADTASQAASAAAAAALTAASAGAAPELVGVAPTYALAALQCGGVLAPEARTGGADWAVDATLARWLRRWRPRARTLAVASGTGAVAVETVEAWRAQWAADRDGSASAQGLLRETAGETEAEREGVPFPARISANARVTADPAGSVTAAATATATAAATATATGTNSATGAGVVTTAEGLRKLAPPRLRGKDVRHLRFDLSAALPTPASVSAVAVGSAPSAATTQQQQAPWLCGAQARLSAGYAAGDVLEVLAPNCDAAVAAFLRRMKLRPDDILCIDPIPDRDAATDAAFTGEDAALELAARGGSEDTVGLPRRAAAWELATWYLDLAASPQRSFFDVLREVRIPRNLRS